MRIGSIDSHKSLVRSILNNFALLDHNDAICHAYSRETMGNEQSCGASSDLLKLTEDFCFRWDVCCADCN